MPKKKLQILIVEDNVKSATDIKNSLTNLGYNVIAIAKNSDDAFHLFTTETPDIAILNVKMRKSKLDGIELAHKMNATQKIPLIYLTSHDDDETRQRAKTTNPAAYLLKFPSEKQLDLSIEFAINNFFANQSGGRHSNTFFCPILHKDSRFVFVKSKDTHERIDIDDIYFLKAEGASCQIFTSKKRYIVYFNLKQTLIHLDNDDLKRVHNSYAVNFKKVIAFNSYTVFVESMNEIREITVSKKYGENIFPLLPKIGIK